MRKSGTNTGLQLVVAAELTCDSQHQRGNLANGPPSLSQTNLTSAIQSRDEVRTDPYPNCKITSNETDSSFKLLNFGVVCYITIDN